MTASEKTAAQKASTHLPSVLGKIDIPQLLEFMERVIPEESVKYKFNEVDAKFVLLDVLKNNPDMPSTDVVEFFYKAMTSGAKPMNKEIYLIPFKQSTKVNNVWVKISKGTVVFSYHFFNRVAELTGQLQAIQASSERRTELKEDGETHFPLVAMAKVFRKGSSVATMAFARYEEFVQYSNKKDKTPNKQWGTSPSAMLEKCAISRAMRLAFPNILGGYYTEEELGAIFRGFEHKHQDFIPTSENSKQLQDFNEHYRQEGEKPEEAEV